MIPVAWMRDKDDETESISTMTACISNRVKEIWMACNPKQVERYTIPLYSTIPVAIPPMNYREEEDGSLVPPEDDERQQQDMRLPEDEDLENDEEWYE